MTVTYNDDCSIVTYLCVACGHKHTKETGAYGKTLDGYGPFIEMDDFELHSTDYGWSGKHRRNHRVYACPKCGVLQIWI